MSDPKRIEEVTTKEDGSRAYSRMSFGERAVGISFNPSTLPGVDKVKSECAKIIDTLNEIREESTDGEVKAQLTLAIRKIQEGQMWGVKAITWR